MEQAKQPSHRLKSSGPEMREGDLIRSPPVPSRGRKCLKEVLREREELEVRSIR